MLLALNYCNSVPESVRIANKIAEYGKQRDQ